MKHKPRVAKLAETTDLAPENRPGLEMKKIAIKMAELFAQNFSPAETVFWHTEAAYAIFKYGTKENSGNAAEFLRSFGYLFYPEYLVARNETERKALLVDRIPALFGNDSYKGIKECLSQIGIAYLAMYATIKNDPNYAGNFLKLLVCLVGINELNCNYEYWEDQIKD